MASELRLERLLGTRVLDAGGRAAGRVEEVHARRRGGELVVTELVLGTAGLVERLSLGPMLRALVGRRLYPEAARYTVDWDKIDLADPARPRLRVRLEDLRRRRPGRRRPARRASA